MVKSKKKLQKKTTKKSITKIKVSKKKVKASSPKKRITKSSVKKIKALPVPSLRVRDVMISKVLTVDQTMPIIEVAKLMTQNNIGAVVILSPILDAIGIFTERDLMNRVISKGVDLNKAVLEVMTHRFECVQMDDEMTELPNIMMNGNFRHLPVVDGRKVVGMISIRDIVRVLLSK